MKKIKSLNEVIDFGHQQILKVLLVIIIIQQPHLKMLKHVTLSIFGTEFIGINVK